MQVVKDFSRYFPKEHHPACDRKGQNDCDCVDLPLATVTARALKRAFHRSIEATPRYKHMTRLIMRKRTKLIRDYYNSITEDDLWLPPHSNWRQFRFFVWNEREHRMIVTKIKDNFKNNAHGKTALLRRLRQHAPHHCYYTTGTWINPQSVGPDPNSRGGRNKFYKKKQLMTIYNNSMMWRELYFDVDFYMPTFTESADETLKLAKWYGNREIKSDQELTFVFSGGKGFHLIDFGFRLQNQLTGQKLAQFQRLFKDEKLPKRERGSAGLQLMDREWKTDLVSEIRETGILIDYDVTPDPRRIIRLPGTIHGKRGRLCRLISQEELTDFDPGPALW